MGLFEEREKAFENKFAHDEEILFRARARTHKLFAAWAAEQLGFDAMQTGHYVQEIIELGMANRQDWTVNDKVLHDLNSKGLEITGDTLNAHYETVRGEAMDQIMTEEEERMSA